MEPKTEIHWDRDFLYKKRKFYMNLKIRSGADGTGNRELDGTGNRTQSGPYGSKNRKLKSIGIGIYKKRKFFIRILRSEADPTESGTENWEPRWDLMELVDPWGSKKLFIRNEIFFIRIKWIRRTRRRTDLNSTLFV